MKLLIIPLWAAIGACSSSIPAPQPGEIRHVLMISLDTTRADHLGAYGDTRGLTPHLDSLAARSVRFDDAMSPAPTTLAAHTSILTGSYPQTHGVARNGFVVHPDNVTLPEILQAMGWRTGAVIGSFALESRFGLDQGFEVFDENFTMGTHGEGSQRPADARRLRDQNQRNARQVTDAALEQIDRVGDAASFHFVHYFDPHVPYEAPAAFVQAHAAPGAGKGANDWDIERQVGALQAPILGKGVGLAAVIKQGLIPKLLEGASGEAGAADLALASLYATEVAYLDSQVGRLITGLDARGLLENTLVVLTGDHGETFWEHGDFWNHGLMLHQTTVHVPLMLAFPDGRGAGRVVAGPVSTVDVLPTVAEVLGLDLPERAEGISLVSAIDGGLLPQRALFSVATQPYTQEPKDGRWRNIFKPQAVRMGPWKYVRTPYMNGYEQLFHLGRDPGEQHNLCRLPLDAETGAALKLLRQQLQRFSEDVAALPSEFHTAAETSRKLESLGYVQGGGNEQD